MPAPFRRMKNRLHARTLLITIVFYVVIALYLAVSFGWSVTAVVGTYAVIAVLSAVSLFRKELAETNANKRTFNRNYPFRHYGASVGNYQHVFAHDENVLGDIREAISCKLSAHRLAASLLHVEYTDTDKDLEFHEAKSFHVATAAPTVRGTRVSLVIHSSAAGNVQSVMWWILQYGSVDWNEVFAFAARAPITMPFWIGAYLRKQYDLLNKVRRIPSSFFNQIDLQTNVRAFHETIYDTLVEVLDARGVDTSDLKMQRAQVLNINVSGGQTSFGDILQGGVNKLLQKPSVVASPQKA